MNIKNYNYFLKADLSEYIGNWIAICEGKIVANGLNLKNVFNEAKIKCPSKKPLVIKVPEKETLGR